MIEAALKNFKNKKIRKREKKEEKIEREVWNDVKTKKNNSVFGGVLNFWSIHEIYMYFLWKEIKCLRDEKKDSKGGFYKYRERVVQKIFSRPVSPTKMVKSISKGLHNTKSSIVIE